MSSTELRTLCGNLGSFPFLVVSVLVIVLGFVIFVIVLCRVYVMLPLSLDCPFFIAIRFSLTFVFFLSKFYRGVWNLYNFNSCLGFTIIIVNHKRYFVYRRDYEILSTFTSIGGHGGVL